MSTTIQKESDNIFVICVKGILTYSDLKEIENAADGIYNSGEMAKVLVLAEDFSGWGKEGDWWGHLIFMLDHDPFIAKIAVVTDDKWRDEILRFLGSGRREASVKSFFPKEIDDARDWLQDDGT